jgi:hypothetical protein
LLKSAKLCYSVLVMSGRVRNVLALSCLVLAGCRSCKNEHPYVPYAISDEAGETDVVLDGGEEATTASPHETSATQAPPGTSTWTTGGVTIVAPAGLIFELAVVRDFDGDGKSDVAALARKNGDDGDLGSLLYYHADASGLAAPITVAPSPTLAPPGASCISKRRMSAIGRHSLYLELGAQCTAPSAKDPSRQISVWTLHTQPRVHLSAQVIDPPGAPKLSFYVDASDADGDGLDDVLLHASVEGGDAPFEPLPRAEATIRWFDRPAGMSRDPDGPDGSLRVFAAGLAMRAAKSKDAPQVLAQARAVRVLWSALCGDSRAPRVVHLFGGAPITCGASRALEEAGLAEARANAVLGNALGAIVALDRAQIPPATKTAQRAHDAETWIGLVAPVTQATQVRAIAAVPDTSRSTTPAWGALAFESSGKLLVRTAAGVVRVDPDQGDESDASDQKTWGQAVVSPDGSQRFTEAFEPCDGGPLHATFASTADGTSDTTDILLPIASHTLSRCTNAKGTAAPVVPLASGNGGLEAIVAGEPILVTAGHASRLVAALGQPTPRGSARSPDGKTLAYATSLGILVQGPTKSRLLRATTLDGTYGEQRDCTASDDGTHVACVRAGRAWVATF